MGYPRRAFPFEKRQIGSGAVGFCTAIPPALHQSLRCPSGHHLPLHKGGFGTQQLRWCYARLQPSTKRLSAIKRSRIKFYPADQAKQSPHAVRRFLRVFFCQSLARNNIICYNALGAASNGRRLAPFCGGSFLAPDFTEGGDPMVTYSELFQFVIMLTGIIALIFQVAKKK